MSLTTSTKYQLKDKHILSALQPAYRSTLLQISFELTKEDQKYLEFYCSDHIPRNATDDVIDILSCLEKERKISLEDLHFLKDAMREVRRLDIDAKLTKYEIQRDLTLLLDLYVRKIIGKDSFCCSVAVKRVFEYLERLMKNVRDRVDIKKIININLTVDSSNDLRKALADFEQELNGKEQTFSWHKFTMLVVYAGEIIAVASTNEDLLNTVIESCSAAADELSSRMTELKSWEDFLRYLRERCQQDYHRQNAMESGLTLSLQKQQIAEVVEQLKEAFFFPIDERDLWP